MASAQKRSGAYFTPEDVARSLVAWVIRSPTDRLLDPSCGDGRFLAAHPFSVGVEEDEESAAAARHRAPSALVHSGDFFAWAAETDERFECAAGNPPFIRYQTFAGETRKRAQKLCSSLGATFSGLASSWAPFLVATASLLKPGGRMAFVVPAEIGHAPYAVPLLEYLAAHFAQVTIIAIRRKLFPDLSEDCWLLHAEGAGEATTRLRFFSTEQFRPGSEMPRGAGSVDLDEWRGAWRGRLRPYLLSEAERSAYLLRSFNPTSRRLGDLASVGIGYVSGANDFFHLRPSIARRLNIPEAFLSATVRNGRALPRRSLTSEDVRMWFTKDEPILLLRLPKEAEYPQSIQKYLDGYEGRSARTGYKCRTRTPWWSVPDVRIPDLFLTYMSGASPNLVRNAAGCTGTNSVHYVQLRSLETNPTDLARQFESPSVQLSCEIEGHPLGGGMLKLEPREACRIVFPGRERAADRDVREALATLRAWRHCQPVQEDKGWLL